MRPMRDDIITESQITIVCGTDRGKAGYVTEFKEVLKHL